MSVSYFCAKCKKQVEYPSYCLGGYFFCVNHYQEACAIIDGYASHGCLTQTQESQP